MRSKDDHPIQIDLQNNVRKRLETCSSFCHKATELSPILPEKLDHRATINLFPSPPWLGSSFCINQVSPSIPRKSGESDPLVLKLEKSLACNSSSQVNHTIYTDGSTSSSTSNGELQQSSPQVFLLNLLLCQASFTIH